MRISIDIDGILAIFTGQDGLIQPIANKLWPGIMPEGYQPPDWDHTDIFTKQHWNRIWEVIKSTDNFWYSAKPYYDNLSALRHFLVNNTADLFFITSRADTTGRSVQLQTFNWMLDQNLPVASNWNYSAIVSVPNSKHKRQVMEALNVKFSVDDLGPTVAMCNEIPGHRAYVLDRSWNRDQNYGPRVGDLKEFLDIVAKESK